MVRPLSPLADWTSARELRTLVKDYSPDVVHSHGSKGGVMARTARLGARLVPVVHSPHGYAFAGFFTSTSERVAYRVAESALAPLTSRLLCVCEHEARLAAKVAPRKHIRVVHNGVDPSSGARPDPELEALRQAGPLVGCVSGLRPGKGVETLVKAMPRVLEKHPDARLAIAGDGPERARLLDGARAAGVLERLVMLGERSDVASVLASLDAFVMPSWAESFPYSILEAMAEGCAIVSTDVGGVGEAIGDGAGILVTPRDAQALAAGVCRLLDDRAGADAFAREARLRQRDRFTLSRMVEGTLAVYDELIAGPGRNAQHAGKR
jgi:glycosyltransferase involved in cell wall biosynthesis